VNEFIERPFIDEALASFSRVMWSLLLLGHK
jgi:hypothetical protein